MKEQDILSHGAYGVSMVILMNRCLWLLADAFALPDVAKVLFFGAFSISVLLLGLFKFHKSLSFGLVLGGIFSGRLAWYYFHFRITEILQFLIALISLGAVCFALYRLYESQHGHGSKKVKRSKREKRVK